MLKSGGGMFRKSLFLFLFLMISPLIVSAQQEIREFRIPQLRGYQTRTEGSKSSGPALQKLKQIDYAAKRFDELLSDHDQAYANSLQFEGEALEKRCTDEKDCLVQLYYDGVTLKVEGRLKNRMIDGPYKEFFPNGQLKSEVNKENGIKNGVERGFTEEGVLVIEKNYKNGIHDGRYKGYYENGALKLEGEFQEGKLTGETKTFYDDSTPMRIDHYLDGKVDGASQVFYKNGKLRAEYQFKQGRKDGTQKEYHEDGALKYQASYQAGQLITEQ